MVASQPSSACVLAILSSVILSTTSTFGWIPVLLPFQPTLRSKTKDHVEIFTPKSQPTSRRRCRILTHGATPGNDRQDVDNATSATSDANGEDDDLLSDIDARVLRSLLQDADKLNLQQEENMKKLLERGVSSKAKVEPPKDKAYTNEGDGSVKATEVPYSSQVLQTLADTKLWQKLKRNVDDWTESAKIAISNRIERDVKLVASLGIFAFERALKDVSRALPAASSVMKSTPARKIFQLNEVSSYQEPPQPQEARESSTTKEALKELSSADLRREFATPQDEFRAVSKEIQQIFQLADQQAPKKKNVSPFFASRADRPQQTRAVGSAYTLKSTAQRGAARLDQAYKRQKQTTLAREKENIAQTSSRFASNLMESAYQVQRELRVEPNEPGYKTKRLREATASTARQLAAAARQTSVNLLSAAAAKKDQQSSRGTALPAASTAAEVVVDISSTSSAANVKAKPVDFLDPQTYFAFKRETKKSSSVSSQSIPMTAEIQDEEIILDAENDGFVKDVKAKFVDVMDAALVVEEVAPFNMIDPTMFVDTVSTAETNDVNYASTYTDMANAGASTGNFDPSATASFFTNEKESEIRASTQVIDQDGDEDDTIRQVLAEVISDDDFEGAFGAAKKVDNMSAEELLEALNAEENEGKDPGPPSILVQLSLRSLDVVFLVAEKLILLLPVAITVSTRISTRFVDVSRDGLGQQGWQPLKTKVRGDRRY